MSLDKIRIVLVGTTHPGNIGGTARAMKNMGLSQLVLVEPKCFPHADATARAAGADDILQYARVLSFEEAMSDCHLVIGTSARSRTLSITPLTPRECAEKVVQESAYNNETVAAIIFGREQYGLTNEELTHCHNHVQIPTNANYSSLNLAMAVQVICYECRIASLSAQVGERKASNADETINLANVGDVELFYQHLEVVLDKLRFLRPHTRKQIMLKLIRLFNRARLEENELGILRGILTAISGKR